MFRVSDAGHMAAAQAAHTVSVCVDFADQLPHDGANIGGDELVQTATEGHEVVTEECRQPGGVVDPRRETVHAALQVGRQPPASLQYGGDCRLVVQQLVDPVLQAVLQRGLHEGSTCSRNVVRVADLTVQLVVHRDCSIRIIYRRNFYKGCRTMADSRGALGAAAPIGSILSKKPLFSVGL